MRGKFTLTLPHPNPLQQVEREISSRERNLYEIMRKTIKIAAIIVVACLVTGVIYAIFLRPAGLTEVSQLSVVTDLAKGHYQVGEEISVKLYLINTGMRPITFFSGDPLLYVKVIDEEGKEVLRRAEVSLSVLITHILWPNAHSEQVYTFALEQPGRYKVVAWAKLSFDAGYPPRWHLYADPIWITVVTGSN